MTDFVARRSMMVDTQIRPNDITKFDVIDALLRVAREDFVPASRREAAYVGENFDLGGNRVLLEPRSLGKMLDALDIRPDELVLDIGSAFGYSAAVIARLAEAVVAVEEDAAMLAEAPEALALAEADNVILHGGPLVAGAPQHGPYDVIAIQGGVGHLPETLAAQLKEGGRMAVLFHEGALGAVRIGYKIDGRMTWRHAFNAGAPILPGFEKHAAFTL